MKKYLQAVGIWALIIPLAILNGGLRENVLIRLGRIALPLSGCILSILIFAVAWLLIPRIKDCVRADYLRFGAVWCALTNLFDLGMLLMDGGRPLDLLKTYDLSGGNLWILVVLTSLLAPYLVYQAKIKDQ